MITNLIRLSLTNRVLVVVASATLLAMGLYTATTMPVDVFPDFTAPTVTILTEAHGMAPTEVETLLGDPAKAKKVLGWEATTSVNDMVSEMVAADLAEAQRDALVKDAGYQTFDHHE